MPARPGTAADTVGLTGVRSRRERSAGSAAKVSIQGSIVLEPQAASVSQGDPPPSAAHTLRRRARPRPPAAAWAAIDVRSRHGGDTEVRPRLSLFPEPLSGYRLSPSSSAVDSVPASALALPFGITPSATDAAGNPRVVDGNGDCLAVQDKGALELQGHRLPARSPCRRVKPLAGVLSHLALSPSAFYPAPSGATISKTVKRKYGTKITYRDSQSATSTFTVLEAVDGPQAGPLVPQALQEQQPR